MNAAPTAKAPAVISGPGTWAWDCQRLGDLTTLAARKVAPLGFRWCALKGGSSQSYNVFTQKIVDAWRAVDVEPVFWWYSVPAHFDDQIAMLKSHAELGLTSFVIDAEVEWETIRRPDGTRALHDWRAQAHDFANRIRDAIGPDACFADAPYVLPSASRLFPFKEFGAVCNCRKPQLYYAEAALGKKWAAPPSTEDLSRQARRYLARADLEWAQEGGMICPILSNMNANGSKRLPLTDLRDSWERYLERPARSIWSLEWLNADETSYFAGERFEDIGADDPMPKDPSAV